MNHPSRGVLLQPGTKTVDHPVDLRRTGTSPPVSPVSTLHGETKVGTNRPTVMSLNLNEIQKINK